MSDKRDIEVADPLYELSTSQANEVLEAFLKMEREAFQSQRIGSNNLDYSAESVVQVLMHIVEEIGAGNIADEDRNVWYMRSGFYFGESLCRARAGLHWALGDPEFAFANHPVVAGFTNGEEAATIAICRNLIEAVAEGLSPATRIENGVKSWFHTAVG